MTTTLASILPSSRNQNESRTILAKLLAREDIQVVHDPNAETATFNGATRVLVMPAWISMSQELSDMLVAHEVGHALHTPAGSAPVEAAIRRIDPKGDPNTSLAKIYLNVVEDARIEREIRSEFPGIKRSFAIGYRELLANGFFDLNAIPMEDRTLTDRINIHAKIGNLVQVPFTDYERGLVDSVLSARNWNEVVDLCVELWQYDGARSAEKKKKQQIANENPLGNDDQGEEEGEESSSDGYTDSRQDDQDSDSPAPTPSDDSSSKNGQQSEPDSNSGDEWNETETEGQTVATSAPEFVPPSAPNSATALEKALSSLRDKSGDRAYGVLPTPDLDRMIITSEEIGAILSDWLVKEAGYQTRVNAILDEATALFVRENEKQVSLMIREFERRRAAQAARRTRTGNRGVLNVNRIHAYKYSEDIFQTWSKTRDGQSHGIVMFVDWSSSMCSVIGDTVNQMLSLATFCRRARIPFQVYAFSSHSPEGVRSSVPPAKRRSGTPTGKCWSTSVGDLNAVGFALLDLISSKLNRREFDIRVRELIGLSVAIGGNDFWNSAVKKLNVYSSCIDQFGCLNQLRLGGTPLNSAIIAAHDILPKFRAANRVEILSAVFLTDGGATDQVLSSTFDESGNSTYFPIPTNNGLYDSIYARHRDSKTSFNASGHNKTDALLKNLRNHVGCRVLGINILHISWGNMIRAGRISHELRSVMLTKEGVPMTDDAIILAVNKASEEGVLVVDRNSSNQYDELYIMSGPDMHYGQEDLLQKLDGNASITRIRNAFMAQQSGGRASRVFLNRFVPMISASL